MSTWEENVRKVIPYTPGEQPNQPDMIKLNTNENPYPPAPGVEKALKEMDMDAMRLYPDPAAYDLVHAIAQMYSLKDEQVFVGVGSDDVLAMSFLTFFNSEKPVLFPDITYSFYDVWADLFKIPYERPALDENFHIKKEDYFRENGGVIFPNPNAPTGKILGTADRADIHFQFFVTTVIAVSQGKIYSLIVAQSHGTSDQGTDSFPVIVDRITDILNLASIAQFPETTFQILFLDGRHVLSYVAVEAVAYIRTIRYTFDDPVHLTELFYLKTAETLCRCSVDCIKITVLFLELVYFFINIFENFQGKLAIFCNGFAIIKFLEFI